MTRRCGSSQRSSASPLRSLSSLQTASKVSKAAPRNVAKRRTDLRASAQLADGVRFELTVPLQVRRISSAVPSTTRPPVRRSSLIHHMVAKRRGNYRMELPCARPSLRPDGDKSELDWNTL